MGASALLNLEIKGYGDKVFTDKIKKMSITLVSWLRAFQSGILFFILPLALSAAPDLDGTWMLASGSSSGFPLFGVAPEGQGLLYTDEGQARQQSYDFLVDDPSLLCVPASLGRMWGNPGSPIEFRLYEDRVIIRYELFDLIRTIKLNQDGHPLDLAPSVVNVDGQRFETMGHSIGWYEEEMLLVETIGYADSYLTTSVGIPQSQAMRTLERFFRVGEQVALEITFIDPIIFQAPFTVSYRLNPSRFEVAEYGCTPENASYQ